MSFRKRNVVIGLPQIFSAARQMESIAPGTRPSPLDGRLTTSTGTSSLDQLLAGHGGMSLGTSLLVQEGGTTDFGGVLLRYFAAEGLLQGHHVHVLGFSSSWRRELPGLAIDNNARPSNVDVSENTKMRIAWRYDTLKNQDAPARDNPLDAGSTKGYIPFCHAFDFTKRLDHDATQGPLYTAHISDPMSRTENSLFGTFINDVTQHLNRLPSSSVHRIVIPSLLSPTLYASSTCQPSEVLKFLHALRALLRRWPNRVTVMMTMPASLHPRSSGLARWIELLCDGSIELISLQHRTQVKQTQLGDDKSQGIAHIHSLPIFHEKGGGVEGSWSREDMSFKLSASDGLLIQPFSLPPVGSEGSGVENVLKKNEKQQELDF